MDKSTIVKSLVELKNSSQKRNFKQSFDIIILLKDIDLKKPDNHVDVFVPLHFGRGKEVKICALVGPELESEAKKVCSLSINVDEFPKYAKDKKALKKLANGYDFFIAQANIMPKVAATFGRVFGPKGKMPNPKAGCVVPPKAPLQPLFDRLRKVVRISVKTSPVFQGVVGTEDMKDEEVAENIQVLYDSLIHNLPGEKNNIKNVRIKLTMGQAQFIDDSGALIKKEEPKEEKTDDKNKKTEAKPEAPKEEPKAEAKKEEVKAEDKKE